MKRLFIPILFAVLLPVSFSCSNTRFGSYTLNEKDAAEAIRQLLQIGAKDGLASGAFSKETMMSAIFPEGVRKVLNTMQQLGITNEVDRFTATLGTAAEKTAEQDPLYAGKQRSMLRCTGGRGVVRTSGSAAAAGPAAAG